MLEIIGETLRAGSVIANAYRLERVVGEGGMAVVWQAVEISSGRRVALKFMQEKRLADSRNQARVLREARATMSIAHPNVAKIFAVLETDSGAPVLVMELLEGQTLRAFLRRPAPLTPIEAARLLMPVISAVQAAHERRIVHRDLKPENIFLLRHPPYDVRVLDFGIAKQFSPTDATLASASSPGPSLTSTGSMIGTPVYMAPEQMFGDEDIDGRADIWSLGIILYECLTLRRPTDGEGFGQILRRITTDPIEPLDRVRPGLPQRLVRLVGAMLTRDRAARPTLAEVQSVLASLETRDPLAPPSARGPDPAPMPMPMHMPMSTVQPASFTPASYAPTRPEAPRPLQAQARKSALLPVLVVFGALVVVGVGAVGIAFSQHWIFANESAAPAGSEGQSTAASGAVSAIVPQPSARPVTGGEDPSKLMAAAMQAWKDRDGKTCLHDLDLYDASPARGSFAASTDPKGSLSLRAMCVMLSGDCETGKTLFRKGLVQGNSMVGVDVLDVDMVELNVDQAAGQYCEGPNLTEREKFLGAVARMDAIGGNMRQGTPAMCKESYETSLRLLPDIVAKHVRQDAITYTPDTLHGRGATCFAHVGDCKSSLEAYRREFPPLSDPAAQAGREKDMFRAYDMIMAGTPCVGKR